MTKHLNKCSKCPEEVKQIFKKRSSDSSATLKNFLVDETQHEAHPSENTSNSEECENHAPSTLSNISTITLASTSTKSQTSIRPFFDSVNSKTQDNLNQALARALYSSATPFRFVENEYFLNFLKLLRPSFIPPTRRQLSDQLLNKEYKVIKEVVDAKIKNASTLTLLSDGWTDINGIPLINIILATPEPVFLKTIDSKTTRHTAEFMFQTFDEIISEIGSDKIHAICTDNAPIMKATWNLLKDKYPSLITYGCAAHSLNLLAKDICKIPSVLKIFGESKKIIQYFKNKHLPRQILKKVQIEQIGREIALLTAIEIRWSTARDSLQSLLKNKEFLQAAIFDKLLSSSLDPQIKKYIIDDEGFWKKVERSFKVLDPIAKAIKMVEGDKASGISNVMPCVIEIENSLKDICDQLTQPERRQLMDSIKNRKLFLLYEIHYAADIVNPKTRGRNLTDKQKNIAMEYILKIGQSMNVNQTELLIEYVNYLAKSEFWSQKLLWVAAECSNPITWWKGLCENKKLSKVAVRVLQFPASSSSCERNWKTHSIIKTKKRNRLTIEKTEKLVMVKSNLNLLKPRNMEVTTRQKIDASNLECLDEETQEELLSDSDANASDTEETDYETDDIIDDNDEEDSIQDGQFPSDNEIEDIDMQSGKVVEDDENEPIEFQRGKVLKIDSDNDIIIEEEIVEEDRNKENENTDNRPSVCNPPNILYLKDGQDFFLIDRVVNQTK